MIDYTAMAEQLSGEYRTVFEKTELYSDMNGVPEDIKADKLMNLLDLLMTAEAEQKPSTDIIGTDIDRFCKEYFADYNIHDKIMEIPEKIYEVSWGLLVILIMDILLREQSTKNILYMKSDLTPIIGGLLLGVLLTILFKYLIGPIIYRSKKIPSIIFYVLVLLLFVVSVGATAHFISDRKIPVSSFPFLVAAGSYTVIYLIIRSVSRYRKTGSIRKPKPAAPGFEFHPFHPKESAQSLNMENVTQEALVKRYQRINKKRSRKNQPVMTTQEFIDKVRKEDAIVNPICIWSLAIVQIYLGANIVIGDVRSSGFDFGTIVLLIIVFAVYIPLFQWTRHGITQSARRRDRILASWETQDITILEKKPK